MTSILREVCRERLNQEWAQADRSLDNYKNVMSKESKLIDEGEIRKNILDKVANKILALPFPEQAVFHLYYAFHLDDSQINEILMIPYAHGMRISMLNYLQKWTSTPEIFACPESISQICTISLTKLMAEINTTEDIQHVYSRRFRKQLRKIHITQQPTDHLFRGILRDHRYGIKVGVRNSRYQVCRARSACSEYHAGLSACSRISVSGMGSSLLVGR